MQLWGGGGGLGGCILHQGDVVESIAVGHRKYSFDPFKVLDSEQQYSVVHFTI